MISYVGDLWDLRRIGHPIIITTNLTIKRDGTAVMGRGIALEAANRYPWLPAHVADATKHGKLVEFHPGAGVISFAVKHHWSEKADLLLISDSFAMLAQLLRSDALIQQSFGIGKPGCGNGHLDWKEDVEPIFAQWLFEHPDLDSRCIFTPSKR